MLHIIYFMHQQKDKKAFVHLLPSGATIIGEEKLYKNNE